MTTTIEKTLDSLVSRSVDKHLKYLQRGLEKESLRVAVDGTLAQTPHPWAIGSSLTHPSITTDYSESLLEFVTGVHDNIDTLLKELYDIHHFTYQYIGEEKLWVNSMPCIVQSEEKIPIARYGSSNIAKMKEIYRQGLSHRYGSLMQTISGIHFNFSMPDLFWKDYLGLDDGQQLQDATSGKYFDLIRNFHRNSWITTYLFGASPAVCRSFLRGREHQLKEIEEHSFYAPDATSLRLSGLGYSNEAQTSIQISYNSVHDFVKSLRNAILIPHPEYQRTGVKTVDGYQQLNANLLQIENEFYSSIRPKRVTPSGQSPSRTLKNRGVQYVEVRSIDLNPFEPIGIHSDCVRFFDLFLLYCLFEDSPEMTPEEFSMTRKNQQTMVIYGRDSQSTIELPEGDVNARRQMNTLLNKIFPIARLLDQVNGHNDYSATLEKQFAKVSDSNATPSARIINQMFDQGLSFYEFSMQAAEISESKFKKEPLSEEINQKYVSLAQQSHINRQKIEESDTLSFDAFLEDYFYRQNQD